MKEIVRIWVYKVIDESLRTPDAKHSDTNRLITKQVRGDFEYYAIEGETVARSCRRDADKYVQATGRKVNTIIGYPSFMVDLGYRA